MATTDLELVDGDSKKPLKLISFELHVRLECFLSETTATMTFFNESDKVLDGELLFPLPENGYVTGYSLDMNGVLVDGVIVSKQDGRVAFETTGGNNSCGMIEQAVGNVYKTRVYPVPPKGSRTIKIVFCSELKVNWTQQNRVLNWSFPGNIPQTKLETLSIDITIGATPTTPTMTTLSPELRNFPKLSYNHQDHCYEASFRAHDFLLSGQLLQIETKTNSKLFVVEPAKDGYYFAIADNFTDNSHSKQVSSGPQTINVIWDCSFSQRGNCSGTQMYFHVLSKLVNSFPNAIFHITQLRNDVGPISQFRADQQDQCMTLLLGLIYDGGTDFQKLNLKREQVVKIDGKDVNTNYSFVVLFSNGVNTLGDENIKINSSCPLHAFSTESGANHDFLKKISASSGGTYTNLDKSTPSNFSIAPLLKSINNEQSLFKNVVHKDFEMEEQDSPKFDTRLIPHIKNIPLPSNHYVTVVGWLPSLPTGNPTLELEYGTTSETQSQHRFSFDSAEYKIVKSKKLVRTFWAKKRIAELLEDELNEEQMEELVSLSKKYRLLTPHTSMLVLDDLESYLQHSVKPPKQLKEMRASFEEIIESQKIILNKKKENKILGVLSLWDRRLQWWQGADESKIQPHFRDFGLPIPNDLWENPGPDYEFSQFAEELNKWKQQKIEKPKIEQQEQPPQDSEPVSKLQRLQQYFDSEPIVEPWSVPTKAPTPEIPEIDDYEDDYEEEPQPEPQLEVAPTKASAIRRGERIVVDGKELTVYDVSTSKTGKHGSAKIHFTMMDENGKKVEQLVMSTHNVEKAISPAAPQKEKSASKAATPPPKSTAPTEEAMHAVQSTAKESAVQEFKAKKLVSDRLVKSAQQPQKTEATKSDIPASSSSSVSVTHLLDCFKQEIQLLLMVKRSN